MTADLLIVGASFAGCACAISAAKMGLRVRLIDKKVDVGSKLHTTGIIVRDAIDNNPFLQNIPQSFTRKINAIRLFSPSLKEVELRSPGYYFLATDTPNLMRWMVKEAINMGVDVRLGQSFTDARIVADRIEVDDQGTFKYLVGADGPQSRVAKVFGLTGEQQFLYGVEHELTSSSMLDHDALYCFISKQHAKGYIGWALQGVQTVQLGAATRYRQGNKLPDLSAFKSHIAPVLNFQRETPTAIRAGFIPCGGLVKNFFNNNVLLVGDAAGLVSPVTAGGIHTAWKHGWAMGEAIAHYLKNGNAHPGEVAQKTYARFTLKRLLRWGYDHFQTDWIFNTLLHTKAMRAAAQQVYFHQRA